MTDSHHGLRILIVEDNPSDHYLITELLSASVIKIQLLTIAETLGKAVELLQKETFDIILLDLSLPDSSGISTFTTIKNIAGKMPVIILSGTGDLNITVEAISLGAQDYHIKGELDEKTLTKTILYSIERKRKLENLRDDNERYITISKAELELMQSDEITRRIINSALDAIICIDIYGKITVWNPQAEKIFGWKQHEILGKKLTETIIPAEYREQHEKGMKHYLAKGEGPLLNKLIEITAMNREGKYFPVELTVIPLTEGGTQYFCAFVRDITEMKKAETELIKSGERFEMITRTTNDAVWEWDFETGKMWANETHQQLYGLTTSDPIPEEKEWQQRLHPDDRASMIKKQADALASDVNVFITEYRFNTEKEGYKNIYDRCYIVRNAEGNAIRILGSMMDITERKKADELIKDSESKFRAFFENSMDGILLATPEGVVLAANPAACAMFGMTEEEVCQLGRSALVDNNDGSLSSVLQQRSRTGKAIGELNCIRKDGSRFPAEISSSVFIDGTGKEKTNIIIRDISERKKNEETLERTQQNYVSLVNTVDGIVWEADAKTFAFSFVNEKAERLLGYPVENWINENGFWASHIHPDDRNWAVDYCVKCTREMKPHEFEYRMIAADGRTVWLRDIVSVIVENDEPVRLRGIMIDITEKKYAEAALRSSEQNLRQVLTSTAENFYVIDKTCRITLINESAEKNMSKAWGKLVTAGTNILDAVPVEKAGFIGDNLKQVFAGKKVEYEVHQSIDGLPEWILINYMPVIDEKGAVTGAYIVTKDISEQKKAEAEILKTNARFHMLTKATSDIVWDWDMLTDSLWWNDNYYSLLGIRKEKDVTDIDHWYERIHPDDLDRVKKDIEKARHDKTTLRSHEYRYAKADGTYLRFLDRSFVMRDLDGHPYRMIGSMVDMTPIYAAQKEVAESENRLRTIYETEPECIKLLGPEGELLDMNPAGLAMIEADGLDMVKGHKVAGIVSPPYQKAFEALTKDVFKGNSGTLEFEIIGLKGTHRWLETHAVPMRDAAGTIIALLGVTRNITERKLAQETIKESEEKYKALVENAPEALVVFDVDTRNFVSVSESAERLFKMSREELLKIGPVEVSPEYQPGGKLSAELAMEKIRETVEGGKPSFEWTHCDKEGNLIPCEVWLVRLPSETQTLIRGSIIDITVRKKAELKLKESEEKYRSVIEQATDFIMITDQQGNFIDANSSFYKTFGYSKEELLQLNIGKVIDPEQLKIRPVRFDLLIKGETVLNERKMMTKDGAVIDVEANVKMLPDGRILAIARDIRDRKKAEEQLSNERNLLRSLIDNLPDYIYVKDTSFNYLINNRAFVKLVGAASEEENTRKNSIDLFGEEVGQINMEEDKKVFETGETIIDRDEPIVTNDGENLWLLTTKVPLKDQENKVMGILGISKDITGRKEAERIIEESEEKYRTMIEQAPDGIFIANQEGLILDVNTAGCTMMGYTKEELRKFRYTELIAPENLRNFPLRMDDLNSGKIVLSERILVRKDGSEILVEINAKLRSDGLYQSFIRDITDRRKAEQAVMESEEKYRTLVEQAVDAIALYDASGKILDVNTGSVKLLGYSKEELMSMYLSDVLTKEEIQAKPVQYDVLQKGESTIKQRMMRKKDGSKVQTEVRSQKLPDGRFLSVIRDLTERVKAQDQIQKEKELSDSIINSLPGLFYLVEESGKYIRWNKLKEKIGGYTANEMSQMNCLDFFEGEEKALVRQRMKDGFTNGVTDVEAHLVTKKGQRILFYFTGIAIDYEGKKCLMGTGIDISDRKKAEQELEESYKAIRILTEHLQNIREEERAHMAREIHDELGQQLTVLKMDISWINKKMGIQEEPVKERMKELLIMLDETVKSVRRISSELRPSLLDDLGLIAAMEWQLTEFEKRFEIKTLFKPDDAEIKLPESMKTGLFRILQESLTNVARHSKAKKVKVMLYQENGSIVLSVADNGVGFDKQNTIGKKTLGILGMQERTSMMGGTYEITGKPGKGTRVVATIPLSDRN